MNRPSAHPLRMAAGLFLPVAATLPAACGGSTPDGSTPDGSNPDGSTASSAQYEPGLDRIVVAKSHTSLRDAMQGALQELLRSGVYGDILARWHVPTGAVQQ